ncbi:MAG: glycoside hydrolase family 15 protein, partial [Sulfolobus sp.]|nr:glycoside hydrolase family 15 protein [Sulfolobus sp.]
RTDDYWDAWLIKAKSHNDSVRRSLLTIAAHYQNNGAIPAALDTDIMRFNRDTYNYVWHRDAAFAVIALTLMGYEEMPRQFFKFTLPLIQGYGYLFQKYTTDGTWGSTWHPWTTGHIPIQEDETALVLYALWVYFKKFENVDFIKPLYAPMIKASAEFLVSYMNKDLNLPLPSYDLWEERLGVHIFTSSAVYIALLAAADFTEFFGETDLSKKYLETANKLRESILNNFYVGDHFARTLTTQQGKVIQKDLTVDASSLYVTLFGVVKPDEHKAIKNRETIEQKLNMNGGIIRYEEDNYLREANQKPNRWFITTLWLAQHYAYEGNKEKAYEYLNWILSNSLKTGILPEQISPSGNYPSVAPLVWSHAELIKTYYILQYGFDDLIPRQPLA